MVVTKQHRPLGPWPLHQPGVDGPVRVHRALGCVAAVHVGAGMAGVLQHPEDSGVGEPAPVQLSCPHPAEGTQREPTVGERSDHPVGRAARTEGGEQVTDGGLDLGVGVNDDPVGLVVDIADWQLGPQLAACRGGLLRLL